MYILLLYIPGRIDLTVRDKNFSSLDDFQQHSQRIKMLEYDTKLAAADDVVSSMNKNYLLFPEHQTDTEQEYVYNLCVM